MLFPDISCASNIMELFQGRIISKQMSFGFWRGGGINRKKKNWSHRGIWKLKKKKTQNFVLPKKAKNTISTSICIRLGCLQRPVRMGALFPKLSIKNSPSPFCYSGPRSMLGKEIYPHEAEKRTKWPQCVRIRKLIKMVSNLHCNQLKKK